MKPTFHDLALAEVERLTDDAWALTFEIPEDLAETFAWQPGQHLTIRGADDVRRSFSIADAPTASRLRIGVKQIPGGAFSDAVVPSLKAGDVLDVMSPTGLFTAAIDASAPRRHVAIAVGSGITPILAIVTDVLQSEPEADVVLIYANATTRSVMFLEEVQDLKDVYSSRFSLFHVLSREQRDPELLSGRLNPERVAALLDLSGATHVDEWYLCGPLQLVQELTEGLRERGGRFHSELFHVDSRTPAKAAPRHEAPRADAAQVRVRLSGRSTDLMLASDGPPVLEAALAVRGDLPFACKGGVCGTCRAKLVEGTVRMDANYALEPDELERGYVLTCQSHPTSDRVVLDYDA